jgi:hypothetical protein
MKLLTILMGLAVSLLASHKFWILYYRLLSGSEPKGKIQTLFGNK